MLHTAEHWGRQLGPQALEWDLLVQSGSWRCSPGLSGSQFPHEEKTEESLCGAPSNVRHGHMVLADN